jgi:hypothetical protein
MDSLGDQIIKRIAQRKPKATVSTVKTYKSLINNLLKTKDENMKLVDWDWLDESAGDVSEFISEYYKDKPLSTVKTLFAALYGITGNEIYREQMMKMSADYVKEQMKQKKSPKQEENWMSFKDVERIVAAAHASAKPFLSSKTPLTGQPLQIVQDYIILALTTGVFIAPRRSQDWTEMKIRGMGTKKNDVKEFNYFKGNQFHFVKYKTAHIYGEQTIDIPTKLKTLLTKWKKLNPYEFLLVNGDGTQMSIVRITQILHKLFQRNISTSMLRHIYITDKLGGTPALEDMQKMADDMGHSVEMQLQYIKR